jgi:rhamnose utilization protein RhaD (predicted bifunctional aldolase and dehydrogenase)
MSDRAAILQSLLDLSHDLGREDRALAILGEGNTSARLSDETFLVKASGSTLGTLREEDVVECRSAPLLAMLDRTDLTDQQIEDELFACRVDPAAKKPSVEALFHALLLSLPGIRFVAHAHPIHVNRLLCSNRAMEFAENRLFPDEIVCCGPKSVLVPYTDPGLVLSRVIRSGIAQYMEEAGGAVPRVVLLVNHGVITLGASPSAAKAAMFMADKAARIFGGAAALGGPVFLTPAQVDRIANRIDEHYRQRALKL